MGPSSPEISDGKIHYYFYIFNRYSPRPSRLQFPRQYEKIPLPASVTKSIMRFSLLLFCLAIGG